MRLETRDEELCGPGLCGRHMAGVSSDRPARRQTLSRDDMRTTNSAARSFHSCSNRGVVILAGTDAGFLNSYDYPVIGLHDELGLLVKAGLTPLQALQTSTINGARWLGYHANRA